MNVDAEPLATFSEGTKFLYDGKRFEISATGNTELIVSSEDGRL